MGHQTRKWSYKHDKLRPTQCCHAFTLALGRLSCSVIVQSGPFLQHSVLCQKHGFHGFRFIVLFVGLQLF